MDFNTGGFPNNLNNTGQGPVPYITDLRREIIDNTLFYSTRWTSRNMQLALMSVPVDTETGLDVHYASDQFFYIEKGEALVIMGPCYDCIDNQSHVYEGYGIIIPAGIWHNVINISNSDLKMCTIFAPAFSSYNTVYRTKEEWFEHYELHDISFPQL